MFDIGFSELFVIGVVALLVLGPERLPRVARTAGHLLGRLQRYVSDVKADISREMQLEELRKLQAQVEQQVRDVERQASEAVSTANKEVDGLSDQMKAAMAEQEKYAAIEQQAAEQDLSAASPDVPQEVVAASARPQPESAQLSLDIPLPEATPATPAAPADKT
ncbi:Sec-independent protein translocase protein TatB [Methyloversatilis universalis]|uniref:Sec-independent protein translocase protein TatB n=1 Tax=Methyloversatilis universalis TaxID=378211 RepID=UPI000374A94A|nr:Sec-independent protein translocase protein TatB [Methyloversatilis universalis]